MTRAQQNEIIIQKLTDKISDIPNVQVQIGKVFNDWFRNLVQQGAAQSQPMPAPQPAEGGAQNGSA